MPSTEATKTDSDAYRPRSQASRRSSAPAVCPPIQDVSKSVIVHQPKLAPFIRQDLLKREDLEKVRELLVEHNALTISHSKVDNAGVFFGAEARTGNVWVRDNIYTALALYKSDRDGEGTRAASRIVGCVSRFFQNSASVFDDCIAGRPLNAKDSKAKSSVRFNIAPTADAGDQVLWDDKQNSSLGYFIWLRCRLCCEGKMPMTGNHLRLLGLMFEYLAVLEFWQDEDTGHWMTEEKLQASSIGAVLAAVKEFRRVLQKSPGMMAPIDQQILDAMEKKGHAALDEILPMECVQAGKERDVDSALLTLIYPLDIVSSEMARTIVKNVTDRLMGPVGIRRFAGDSYWCKDFQPGATGKTRSGGMPMELVVNDGEEAQWCVFDPILSAIYGKFYTQTRDYEDLKAQQFHLGRSLAHITGDDCQVGAWLCPESYYLSRNMWIASDVCPLVWSQAALDIAISMMDESLAGSTKDVTWEFKKLDLAGDGAISITDLTSVLVKLNTGLAAEDLQPFLEKFVGDGGKISYQQFIDELFCGALTERG